jgi:dolichol-phosphate mannosyltransferase|tara:strand:+ start:496 stop:1419 length:924 start_codon:yes stop_codon:yes gene_type:complete
MKLSFVVAVYQNAETLFETHKQISNLMSSTLGKYKAEIIFIDDGSTDGSLEELRKIKIKANVVEVVIISFTRNFGQMAAMLAGFKEASGDAIINISADLQDPIKLIPKMVTQWENKAEIVICNRKSRSDPLITKIFSNFAYRIFRLIVPQIPPGGFDFVLMDRMVLDYFNSIDNRHRFFQGDLLWAGYRISLIPYVRKERKFGRSQYNVAKKIKNFLDAVLDSSYFLIRTISYVGITTSILGLIYSASIIWSWYMGETPFDGWAPIMIALLFIGGLIMVMLGVIGEYIWRINEEVRKKPNYIIREKL